LGATKRPVTKSAGSGVPLGAYKGPVTRATAVTGGRR
jgi:hypothetical protein